MQSQDGEAGKVPLRFLGLSEGPPQPLLPWFPWGLALVGRVLVLQAAWSEPE